MTQPFSGLSRTERLQAMSGQKFDLIVIGGGITGAGIALDAQSRGLRTALIDMQDFAAGTSSRSTKLVHGGLRYLKQLDVKVVAEVGKERAIVYENGPHVTTPEWMLLPFYKGGTFGKFSTSLGLRVYDFLAGVKRSERRKMFRPEQTLSHEPLLKKQDLRGGGYYVEYRTDDARLTIEVMKKAVELGAQAVNYAKVEELLMDNGKLIGVRVVDQLGGEGKKASYSLYASKIVNAAGPWVDTLREMDRSKKGKTLHLTKGVHLVFDQSKFPLRQAIYFDTPDGRMVFAIPRDGKTYVGTTDTNYKGDIVNPRITVADRAYVLRAANEMFPTLGLTEADVESSWTGLRPLIHQEGKDPSEISRRDEIFVSDSGLISMAGGKLTGYRKMAETVVDKIAAMLVAEGTAPGAGLPPSRTRTLPISGGDVGGSAQLEPFVQRKASQGQQLGLARSEAALLAHRYGSNVDAVFALVEQYRDEAAKRGMPAAVLAALVYAIEHEMAVKPSDFFIRRTGALFFDIAWARQWKAPVIAFMAERFGWIEAQRAAYTAELEQLLHEAVNPLEA
ncbi:glycerol-3-phosphate dehydrogenase/oxidase [Paenibacillus sp. GCM10023248]|uniref:glycerol-3-phosphate dehydrogenase/oxidase n=1 Tax=Bacillales TaxID=1385 RepID=UPI00237957DA|nr:MULTISPECIES: glycerol-3-phosphate dehydrogenase/oxidase [Bacillales]MDD9270674.1 glycerol-3-phosphate dehydrogenase/oxidase [Paenibacillus sp. MAHUQ-63]MDR6883417.1 glycerol-3-phosphate dehydrogenase [Bacillus sp. 3255]